MKANQSEKEFYKCSLIIMNKTLTAKVVIELGFFDKLSKVESLRARIQENNPDRVVSLKIQTMLDTIDFSLFENKSDMLDELELKDLLE